MAVNIAQLIDIASDWALDGAEFRSAIGRAIIAIDDATQSSEAQNDAALQSNLAEIAQQLFELVEEEED